MYKQLLNLILTHFIMLPFTHFLAYLSVLDILVLQQDKRHNYQSLILFPSYPAGEILTH